MYFHFFIIISPCKRVEQTWIPFTQECLVLCLVQLAQWFWRWFFKFVNVFSQFRNYLLLGKNGTLRLIKLNSHHPRIIHVKFGCIWSNGSGGKIFLICQCIFAISELSHLRKKKVNPTSEKKTLIPFTHA